METARTVPTGTGRRRVRVAALVEHLEARRLLCGADSDALGGQSLASPAVVATAAAATLLTPSAPPPARSESAPIPPAGLPRLHSLPGAPAAVFLDFDGFGSYAPYDTDGDPSTFGPAEQAAIAEAWRQVASYFSMLNLDVTTEPPSVPYSYSLISNSVTSGQNLGNFPSAVPTNFNTASHATDRPTALAHEIGHSLGLGHQSVFDRRGVKTDEYAPGYDRLHGPIMGVDYAQDVHKWFIGHPSASPLLLQDDLAVMAATLKPYAGGDGSRPDDVPGDLPHARLVAAGGGGPSASGIIERLSDRDAFLFRSPGGGVTLDVVPPAPSMLDATLEVYAADGTLIAAADGAENDQHLAFPALPAGTYYAVVGSHGDYADLGPYALTIRRNNLTPPPPSPSNGLPAPAGVRPGVSAPSVSWDRVDGASGYLAERSTDGISWEVAGTVSDPATTVFYDSGLAGGRRYFYRVSALDASGRSAPSAVVGVITAPDAPQELAVSSWRTDTLVLNWRDVSGETGYRVERAHYGSTSWRPLAVLGPNVTSFTDRGLDADTLYTYRVSATHAFSAPAEATGGTPLPALGGLRANAAGARSVSLRWDPISFGREYIVERSTDGLRFSTLATVTAARFDDTSVEPAKKYTYRVVGFNTWYQAATSDPVGAFTPAEGHPPAPWQVAVLGYREGGGGGGAVGSSGYDAATGTFALLDGWPGLQEHNVRFVYRPIFGDRSITARVASLSRTPPGGIAGLMMTSDVSAQADSFFLGVGPGSGLVLSRSGTGWGLEERLGFAASAPCWLRLVRSGSDVDGYVSTDGNSWRWVYGFTAALGQPVYAGLAVTAGYGHTDPGPGAVEVAIATFDGVVIGNMAPTVAAPAAVLNAPVTGTFASVSAAGRDDDAEEDLTYTWSAPGLPPGASPPAFLPDAANGAGAAKAVFSRAGRYTLSVRITDSTGLSATSSVTVDVHPSLTSLVASPHGQPVRAGQTLQYAVRGLDQFGFPVNPDVAAAMRVDWDATGGSVDPDGLFTAPSSGGWYSVTARATAPGPAGTTATATVSTDVYVYNDADGPTLLAAWSRKTHGRRGTFDLPLGLYGGPYAIEPRRGGVTTIRFEFSVPVEPEDGTLDATEFFLLNATFLSATLWGPFLTLELTGVTDRQLIVLVPEGLTDAAGRALAGDAEVWVWSIYGDVNGDGAVNAADLVAVRQGLRRRVGATDFLRDLDLDGVLTAKDLVLMRARMSRLVS